MKRNPNSLKYFEFVCIMIICAQKEVIENDKEHIEMKIIKSSPQYRISLLLLLFAISVEGCAPTADERFTEGSLAFQRKDYTSAIEAYDKGIEIDSSYFIAYMTRGLSKHYLSDYEGAIKDLDRALSLNDSNKEVYTYRGFAKLAKGDTLGACEDFRVASIDGHELAQSALVAYCLKDLN
jgi:tetratricopeptide (TPR) repeat protein